MTNYYGDYEVYKGITIYFSITFKNYFINYKNSFYDFDKLDEVKNFIDDIIGGN